MKKLGTLVLAIGITSISLAQQTNTQQRSFKTDSNPLNQSVETYNYFRTSESLINGVDYRILNSSNAIQDSSVIDYFNITDYQNQIDAGQMTIVISGTDYRIEMIKTKEQDSPNTIQTKN